MRRRATALLVATCAASAGCTGDPSTATPAAAVSVQPPAAPARGIDGATITAADAGFPETTFNHRVAPTAAPPARAGRGRASS